MKKILIISIFLIPFLVSAQTTTSIGSPLEEYTWLDTFKHYIKQALGITKPVLEKLNLWYKNNIYPLAGDYIEAIKDNIKKGLEEEKQELNQELKEFLKKIWENIKKRVSGD